MESKGKGCTIIRSHIYCFIRCEAARDGTSTARSLTVGSTLVLWCGGSHVQNPTPTFTPELDGSVTQQTTGPV